MSKSAQARGRLQRAASLAAAARTLSAMGATEEEYVASVLALADLGERGADPLGAAREGRPDPAWTLDAADVAPALARLEGAGLVYREPRGWSLTDAGRRAWVAVRSLT